MRSVLFSAKATCVVAMDAAQDDGGAPPLLQRWHGSPLVNPVTEMMTDAKSPRMMNDSFFAIANPNEVGLAMSACFAIANPDEFRWKKTDAYCKNKSDDYVRIVSGELQKSDVLHYWDVFLAALFSIGYNSKLLSSEDLLRSRYLTIRSHGGNMKVLTVDGLFELIGLFEQPQYRNQSPESANRTARLNEMNQRARVNHRNFQPLIGTSTTGYGHSQSWFVLMQSELYIAGISQEAYKNKWREVTKDPNYIIPDALDPHNKSDNQAFADVMHHYLRAGQCPRLQHVFALTQLSTENAKLTTENAQLKNSSVDAEKTQLRKQLEEKNREFLELESVFDPTIDDQQRQITELQQKFDLQKQLVQQQQQIVSTLNSKLLQQSVCSAQQAKNVEEQNDQKRKIANRSANQRIANQQLKITELQQQLDLQKQFVQQEQPNVVEPNVDAVQPKPQTEIEQEIDDIFESDGFVFSGVAVQQAHLNVADAVKRKQNVSRRERSRSPLRKGKEGRDRSPHRDRSEPDSE